MGLEILDFFDLFCGIWNFGTIFFALNGVAWGGIPLKLCVVLFFEGVYKAQELLLPYARKLYEGCDSHLSLLLFLFGGKDFGEYEAMLRCIFYK